MSRKWRFEVLYIRDFARETLEEEENIKAEKAEKAKKAKK